MKGSAIKDFLLFCVECVIGFLRYFVGTIIGGLGFIMALSIFFTPEYWPMAVLGALLLLLGVWMQYKT